MKTIVQKGYDSLTRTPYYDHTNNIGPETAITDGNEDLVEKVSRDAFGNSSFTDVPNQPLASSSIGDNILFQNKNYNEETNLYYYRARYYDPIMGRFLQTDPMSYTDSMNLYQSFNCNPINFTNPMGKNVLVEVTPDGSTLTLKNISIYSDSENIPNQVEARQFIYLRNELAKLAKMHGLKSMRLMEKEFLTLLQQLLAKLST